MAAALPAVTATLTTFFNVAKMLSHFFSDGKIPLAFVKQSTNRGPSQLGTGGSFPCNCGVDLSSYLVPAARYLVQKTTYTTLHGGPGSSNEQALRV